MAETDFSYVKTVVRSILTSSSSSMTISHLLKDYTNLEGHQLSYETLGFNSVYALLKSMKDILILPPNPNMHSTIKLIVDQNTSHIVDLISKQKFNKKWNAKRKEYVPAHKLNDCNSNMKYTTNSNNLENNCNARGYNFVKNHSYSPKPRGYVTKELKRFIETMCGSNNLVSVLRLKSGLINHPDYCKLNTSNIEDSINMLKSFIYIDSNGVHLKDSEYNICYQEKRLKTRNRRPIHKDYGYMSRGSIKPSSIRYLKSDDGDAEMSVKNSIADYYDSEVSASLNNCSEDKPNLGLPKSILGITEDFSDENNDSEIDEYGMSEGLDYSSHNKTKQYLFGNGLDTQQKTYIKSNKELSNATGYTKNACYLPPQSLNLCSEEENNLSTDDIQKMSGIHLKTIIKSDEELSNATGYTKDACYLPSQSLNLCSEEENNLSTDDIQKMSGIHLKTIIKSDEELSNATGYTKDACYLPSQSLNLCSEEENNLSTDDIQKMSGIHLKTIIKSDEKLSSATGYTKDACYPPSRSLSLCSEEEYNLNTNHHQFNNTFTSMTLNKYQTTPKISTGRNFVLKTINRKGLKSTNGIKTAVSSSSNNDKTKYRNMIVSIILNSKTPIAVNNVFRLFKNKYCYDFPLKIFGCISVMDFFRLHPALFKLENEYSTKSIVTIVKQETEKPKCTIRRSFMNASLLDQNTEKKPVTLSVTAKEFVLRSNAATSQCKKDIGDAQISDVNTQTSCSVISKSITNYEIYDSDMVLDSMKKKMRCVLNKYKNGILCNAFMDIYANEYSSFTFSDYGFRSMRDMAFNLPSVFYVKESEDGYDHVLYNACRRSELDNNIIDPALYYKNIPKTVLHNLSIIFDKNRTGISFEKLKHLYCTEFGLCYETLKYGFSSEKHMFESLNKMVEIKDNKLYTLDPFVYIDFVNENSLTEIAVQKIRNYTDLGKNLLNDGSVCNKNFKYTPFQLNDDKLLMVFMAEIFQPSSFYIHLETKLETLNNLMAKLQEFYVKYETKYKVSPNLLFPELACCLQFEDTIKWHRAIILNIVDEDYVKVSYVDYGSIEVVKKTRIRLLALEFGTEPILALHSCLFEHDHFVYNREINELFVEIVDGFKLEAHTGGYRNRKDGDRQMILTLYSNFEKSRININKFCIKELKRMLRNNNGLSIRRMMCT